MLFKKTTTFTADFQFVDKNMAFARLKPHIEDCEEHYIAVVLGAPQLAALQAAMDANTLTAQQTALLNKCRYAIRNLALYIGFPKLNLRINDEGIKKAESTDYNDASAGEMYFARIQFLIDGYRALDALYKFLEDNKADYPLWTGNAAYTQYKQYFLNSASKFALNTGAVENRWLLTRLSAQMDIVEQLNISPAIGAAFFAELKTKFTAGTLSQQEQVLVNFLCKPIALYTYSAGLVDPTIQQLIRIASAATADDLSNKGTPSENYKEEFRALSARKEYEADSFLELAKEYLNDTASETVFATYYSSKYYSNPVTKPKEILPNYNNDTSDTSYVML